MTMRLRENSQLRERLRVKPAQLRELRGYASFSFPYVRERVSGFIPVPVHGLSGKAARSANNRRNRVTHVTTGFPGVTARVTNHFSRNHKGLEMGGADREEKARWVREHFAECAGVAAAFEAEFPGTRLVYAKENGQTLGKPGPDGVSLAETVVGPMFEGKGGKSK